jgi:site-specific DNA-methyltransferase (adenine-specific)
VLDAMKPYYQTEDGSIRIYHARWEDVLAAGVFVPKDIALVHADPPYGVNEPMARKAKGRLGVLAREGQKAQPKDWPIMEGDGEPYDPAALLVLDRPLVTWGGNHYASRLPNSPSWMIWDKRDDTPPDNNADVEMAWSNLGGPARRLVHLWRGTCRASEVGVPHIHATQKPEALSAWVFAHAMARKKLKRGDTVLVPYMGSGPDLRPAQAIGLKVIACELVEEYCRTAVNARLRAVAREQSAVNIGPLFGTL